ncbi:MAG: hypothetical protein GJ680_01335 [Alteromonadaceae bacterium]|nr:hypothetical protein [Alteromonadaceae bacterium]
MTSSYKPITHFALLLSLIVTCTISHAGEASVDCPDTNTIATPPANWQIIKQDWEYFAHYSNDDNGESFQFPLDMDGPSTPHIIEWLAPQDEDKRLGVIHYFSGATGTHISAEITRYAIIDLKQQRLLDIQEASVYFAGSRYHEDENGVLTEYPVVGCDRSTLKWSKDSLGYLDSNGRQIRYEPREN